MSKRYFPQQCGERKKPRLGVSFSDNDFLSSQSKTTDKKFEDADIWGDDSVDELLVLASQACENAFNDSQLPNYTLCMQPPTSSTQYSQGPSTSKDFSFKIPSSNVPSTLSTRLNDKCAKISSPLPGIALKLANNQSDLKDFSSDKIYKGQESDDIYCQLLQLQEENTKLKSENGKLLEKCVTKEGEASILRTQLKNCQISVDNARLEKIKAQEKVQMEWNEKLVAANKELQDLKNQLDFKNMEIIGVKDKCKKLESTKLKLTQVTIGGNDISLSHRSNNYNHNDSTLHSKRVKMLNSGVQTDNKTHYLILNKTSRLEKSKLHILIPHILKSQTEQPLSILDYNEKLQRHSNMSRNKCRLYSSFHRAPAAPLTKGNREKVQIESIGEDLSALANGDESLDRYFNVFNALRSVLEEVKCRLETILQRITTAFHKDMDEKYIETTSKYLVIKKLDLIIGRALYKEEQDILARRMIAILSYIIESSRTIEAFDEFEREAKKSDQSNLFELMTTICVLLDKTSCATLYSGLLLSIVYILTNIIVRTDRYTDNIINIIKSIITARPMPHVCCHVLYVVRKLATTGNFRKIFCVGSHFTNLKMDYDQGVLLYKEDTCLLQVLLRQIEVSLKCIEKQNLSQVALEITRNLLMLYNNVYFNKNSTVGSNPRCDCQVVLMQTIVYGLRICANILNAEKNNSTDCSRTNTLMDELLAVCRYGLEILFQSALKDVEYSGTLSHNEGHLMEFCEIMNGFKHSIMFANMLSHLSSNLQSSPEDIQPSFRKEIWIKSFETFSLTD